MPADRLTALVTSTPSDSHTWNLVYLELLLNEHGYDVINLGACVSVVEATERCARARPDVTVVSSVNGHGRAEGRQLIRTLRSDPRTASLLVVIGGMLTTAQDDRRQVEDGLVADGYDYAFTGEGAVAEFLARVVARPERPGSLRAEPSHGSPHVQAAQVGTAHV